MKHILRCLIFLTPVLFSSALKSQVTKLKNNNNIKSGVALGNIGVMIDDHGALWKTDGTPAGTELYTTKVLVDTTVSFAILNNKIYFSGINANGKELWVTDGTDAGTAMIKDINEGAESSSPRDLFVYKGVIYFFASTTAAGVELWKSDGSTAGTIMVKDINPGSANSYDNLHTSFFATTSRLYFDANDGSHGTELWTTTGSEVGTQMVKDIKPGTGSSNCANFIAVTDNKVLFSADDGTHGDELWISNGSAGGTSLVKDLVSGADGSSPQQFVPYGSKFFFLTASGFPLVKYKLYLTDGTGAGTVLVKDFGNVGIAILANSVIINNKLYFAALNFTTTGFELWSSDGTTAGTGIFKDINPGTASSSPIILPDFFDVQAAGDIHTTLFNGKIFFIADDGTHGTELWITDGTDNGTTMVKDINPGSDSAFSLEHLSWFYTTTGLYFAANDGTHGFELFKTDGTEANTDLVEDINQGSNSSNPFMFMLLSHHIYLTADDGDNEGGNRDLYKIDEEVTTLPVTLVDFTAVFSGKVVDVDWTTATEINTKSFIVQRSYDAVHFNNIGTVNAAGNSSTNMSYSFADATALSTGAKVIYYRLQIVDNDGKSANSKVAKVEITGDGSLLAVYPNPVKDKLYFVTSNSLTGVVIKITDQSGKIVSVQKPEVVQAGGTNTVNVAALAKGVYYLQLISNDTKQTIKFIKY